MEITEWFYTKPEIFESSQNQIYGTIRKEATILELKDINNYDNDDVKLSSPELQSSDNYSILENFSLENPIFTEFRTSCSARCRL